MRIHHIQITAPPEQEAACREFYGTLLNLEEIPKPEPLRARGGAWYRLDGIELHLGIEKLSDASQSKRHVCFEVSDLNSIRIRIKEAGYEIEEATPIDGMGRFFTRDPAGNKVELAEPC